MLYGVGLAEFRADFLRNLRGLFAALRGIISELRQHDDEFIAAKPRNRVLAPHQFTEAAGNLHEQRIPDRMAE